MMYLIEVGDWIHVQPGRLSVEKINPTQLNSYKNRVQEPHFMLHIDEHDIHRHRPILVNGKASFWALLDALFPDDPLPRQPVNTYLQGAPHIFVKDMNAFFKESKVPIISIMLGEIDDPYSTVGKKWQYDGARIITANSGLKAPDCVQIADRYNGIVLPGTWRDSKRSVEVPCVLVNGFVHIHDLGDQLIVGGVVKNERGDNVRPLPVDAVRKGVGWDAMLASVIDKHTDALKEALGRSYPPSKARKQARTSSQTMREELELFMRGHQK